MSLSLDTTGLAPANRIDGEVIAVTPASLATFGCVFLAQGPFFGKNFALSYQPNGGSQAQTPLVQGVDFEFRFELPGFGQTIQDKVWGAIALFNTNLNGTLTISYQSLGGNWSFNIQDIRNYLNTKQFNTNLHVMHLVSRAPLYLPNNPLAQWPLNSIQAITIAQAQLPSIELSIAFVRIDGVTDAAQLVVAEELPLPNNAAKEQGGNLAALAASMGVQANNINMPSGGVGVLGWLSGMLGKLSELAVKAQTLVDKLNTNVAVSQSGNWSVQLAAGANTIGGVYNAALTKLVDSTTTANVVYTCEAPPGSSVNQPVWRIQRLDVATGSVSWAAGGQFNQVASQRENLTYS